MRAFPGARLVGALVATLLLLAIGWRVSQTLPLVPRTPQSTSQDRWVAVERLAAQGRHPTGDLSTAGIELARVGGVHRPVLSVNREASVFTIVTEPDRASRREIEIPPGMQGKTVCVAGLLEHVDPPMSRSFGGTVVASVPSTVGVVLPDDPALYPAVLRLHARTPSASRWESEPFTVPALAHLRFAIGVEEHPLLGEQNPVRFRIVATDGQRETEVFTSLLMPRDQPEDRRWREHEIPLSAFERQTVRLRFETETGNDSDCRRLAYPLWGDPVVVVPDTAPAVPMRNLLLISLDTLRADRLGSYGYDRPTSPGIDALMAAEGTLFRRVFSSFPSTAGSHMTMLTSLDPCVHGVTWPSDPPLRADARTLAELLRAGGYATAAFTEDGFLTTRTGFARGFDIWVEQHNLEKVDVSTTFARGAEWIGAQRAPWFAFLHTYQVHEPYTPPPGYRERVGSPDTPSGAYDGEVRYTDEILTRLLADLRRFGVLDETLIVVTSDHGEQFGEHGLRSHGNSLYDTLLHVPLLMRAPGLVPAGRRIDHAVGLIDLVPTVLDLLGRPPSPWVQGVSLVPLLRGEPLAPRQLFAENWGGVFTMRSTVGDEPKLIPHGTVLVPHATAGERYLIASDPLEEHDLGSSTGPATFEYAARRFAEHCAAPPPPPSPVEAPPLDPAVEEKLRALGYVR